MNPRFHACGSGAMLLDVSTGVFDLVTQERLWALAADGGPLLQLKGVLSVVLGVNNLLVYFDEERGHPGSLSERLSKAWEAAAPRRGEGRVVSIPVEYDVAAGSELEEIARQLRLPVTEVIRLHTGADYHVACIGSVPGFAYLVGLPAQISVPRRQVPRSKVPKGSVAIGGAQTGVMPLDMASGWNLIGHTHLQLFDPDRDVPCLLAPGDRVRFVAAGEAS